MIIDTPNVNMIVLIIAFVLGIMIGIAIGLLWSWRYSGCWKLIKGKPFICLDDTYSEEELDADPDLIGDGFGSWAKKYCEDCGAPMEFVRPGETRCSSECWTHQPHRNSMGGTDK